MIRGTGVLIAAAALFAGTIQAEVKWVTSPRVEKVREAEARRAEAAPESIMRVERYTATREIIWDKDTQQLRKPTRAEISQMVQQLRRLTSKPEAIIAGRVQANGTRQGSIEGEHATVIVARANAEGGYETLCVQTFDEAAAFLGLVRAGSGNK